jgi:hypothetical protein
LITGKKPKYFLLHSIQTGLESIQSPVQRITGDFSMRAKWLEHEPEDRLYLMPIFENRGGLHTFIYVNGMLPRLGGVTTLHFAS